MGKVGIIGGSALYDIEGIEVTERKKIDTPFGNPSDEYVLGKLEGVECVFLPRHGRGHKILPSELNYKANIYGLKVLGVDRIISVSAVGSLKEELKPLDIVLVDQFVDRTNQARKTTFFGDGIVAHIPFADPVCAELKEIVFNSNKALDVKIHDGGTYINMEGPAFSTKAESFLYKSWGMDIIGMTNMPEARLAREAGICYMTIAMVTDYDCWHESSEVETVSIEMIIENLMKNTKVAKEMVKNAIKNLSVERKCPCGNTLKDSIVTQKKDVPEDILEKLKPILGDAF